MQQQSCAAGVMNQAAVLHGVDDLRVQEWPLPDAVAPGQVCCLILQGLHMQCFKYSSCQDKYHYYGSHYAAAVTACYHPTGLW